MPDTQSMTIVCVLIFLFISLYKNLYPKQKRTHIWRKKSAKRALGVIKTFKNDGQIINYLRKLDPFVFEELLLVVVAQNKDCRVIESHRYTGDGGIDGRFIYRDKSQNRHLYLIQAKRYSSYINHKDIKKLARKVDEEEAYRGLFIHTGKSGKATREAFFYRNSYQIEIISGAKLISFIKNGFIYE